MMRRDVCYLSTNAGGLSLHMIDVSILRNGHFEYSCLPNPFPLPTIKKIQRE